MFALVLRDFLRLLCAVAWFFEIRTRERTLMIRGRLRYESWKSETTSQILYVVFAYGFSKFKTTAKKLSK